MTKTIDTINLALEEYLKIEIVHVPIITFHQCKI